MKRLQTQWQLTSKFGFQKLDSLSYLVIFDEEVWTLWDDLFNKHPCILGQGSHKEKKGNLCLGVSKVDSLCRFCWSNELFSWF